MKEQRTPEWYDERKNRITGSLVGAILGVNPYMSREQAMRAKVREFHGLPSEVDDFTKDQIFEYGRQMEPLAISAFEVERTPVVATGLHVHPRLPWLAASPDGLVGDAAVLEVKCPYKFRKESDPKWQTAAEQPHYYAQMQVEMACTGRSLCHFWQWSPVAEPYYELVKYNPRWFADAIPLLESFYEEYLRERKDVEKYTLPVIDTMNALWLLNEYDEIKESIDLADARKKAIIKELAKMTNDQSAIICGRKFTKVTKAGAVSYAAVVKKYCEGVDLTEFTGKSSEYWLLK